MLRASWLSLMLIGCADPATTRARSYNDRDLGDHLQPPGGDDMGSSDLSLSTQKADLAGSSADLAGSTSADLAGKPDLAQPVDDEPPVYVHTATTLYTINPFSYDLTKIGDFNAGDEITDIAEKDDGSLAAVSRTGLYTVDATTGAASLVGDSLFMDVNALTYLSDGRLLAADIPGNVYELTFSQSGPITFITTNVIGSYGSQQTTAGDLISVDDGTTWGLANGGGVASDTNNVLMIVNNVGGTGTPVGPTSFGKLWGAAYSHHRILAFSSTGQVVEIDPASGAGTLKRTYAGMSFYGATSNPNVLF